MVLNIPDDQHSVWLPFVSGGTGEPAPVDLPHFQGLGVGIPHQLAQGGLCDIPEAIYRNTQALLKPDWWYNWLFDQIGMPGYVPMLWRQKWNSHAVEAFEMADETQGFNLTWLVGNEPLVDGQATVTPKEAADLGQRWERDLPGVRWACPGVYINHARSIDFLDDYLDAGGPVPDFWHVHNYAFGINGAIFSNYRFFMWMKRRNVVRPVIISETNLWDDENWQAQTPMMDWLVCLLKKENPVVATCWFAAQYKFWATRMLLRNGCVTRSELGDYFRELAVAGIEVNYSDTVDEGMYSGV